MKKILSLETMINQQFFSFLRNLLLFFIDRLYKEWEHMFGKDWSYCERASERGDLFAKQLIENIIHDRASKYDPYILDGNANISYKAANVTLGTAHVTGLSSLHRTNICSLNEIGNRFFINVNLGAGPLAYQREIMVRFGNFQRKAFVIASLIGIKVSVDFTVEKETGRNGFLLKFVIEELNGFKLSVNGYGCFDWVVNLFISFWTIVLKKIVRNLLENELEQYILNRLPQYQFPVEGTSYRNKMKLNNQHEGVQYDETSLSESFYMKQGNGKPKSSRIRPVIRSGIQDGHKSIECEKDGVSNLEIMKTARSSPETNKWIKDMNSFYLPSGSSDLFNGYLTKNSCKKLSNDKAEEIWDLVSQLLRKTRELSKSLIMIKEKLDSIDIRTKLLFNEIKLKSCLKILDGFDRNIPELNSFETESNSSENTHCVTSSPAKGFKNEQIILVCGDSEESKEYLPQMPLISDRDKVEMSSVFINENPGQCKLLEEIFSEINERSCKSVDGNSFDITESKTWSDNCYSSSMELETSQLRENILKPYRTEPGTFLNPTLKLDSERRKAQINYLEKMFNGKKTKERTEESIKNRHVSVESGNNCQSPEGNVSAQNLDGKLCTSEMFLKESLISFSVDDLENNLKVSANALSQDNECKTGRSESCIKKCSKNQGVKAPEIHSNYSPEDEFDDHFLFMSDISNSFKMNQIEKSLDLEVDSETFSESLKCSKKHDNEYNEKVPFKYVDIFMKEELNENSELKPLKVYNADKSKDSELFLDVPERSLSLCSGCLKKSSCDEISKVEKKWDPFSASTSNTLEISRPSKEEKGNLEFINNGTNLWYQESSKSQVFASLNKQNSHCRDSMAEISYTAGLKFIVNSDKNISEETSHLKPLRDLQEEIITKTRKMISDVVIQSDPADKYSSNFPVLSYENSECEKGKSICDEFDRLSGKESETDFEEPSRFNGDRPHFSITGFSSLECEFGKCLVFTSSESDSENSSETDNDPKYDTC